MHKAGFTLIECLLVCALLAILLGISTISYNKWNLSFTKKDLHIAGKVFAKSFKNCISASGGWKIKKVNGTDAFPCKIEDSDPDTLKKKLKDRLNFACPKDATCDTHTHSDTHTNTDT